MRRRASARAVVHWLASFARNLLRARRRDADLDAEVRAYVDLLADEKVATGMSPGQARRAALLEFGGTEAAKERTRAVRAGAWLAECLRDARYAVRLARRTPGFTLAAMLTLALGIGANTAVFSVVNAVLLRELPYAAVDRLVIVQNGDANGTFGMSEQERVVFAAEPIFAGFATYRFAAVNLTGAGEATRLPGAQVDVTIFQTLGVAPARGRLFEPDDALVSPVAVAMLSEEFWTRRFDRDERLIGSTLTLDGQARTVVGIVPAGVRLPRDFSADPAAVYLPLAWLGAPDPRNLHYLQAIARLAPEQTLASAGARLRARAARLIDELRTGSASLPPTYTVSLIPVRDDVLGEVRPGLFAVSGAVVVLLLIACGNLASLLLARSERRSSEFAMRRALGASPRRLMRQVLTESTLLALSGGALGVVVATAGTRLLVSLGPDLPRLDQVSIDTRVLMFTTGLSVLTGLLFGMLPALMLPRRDQAPVRARGTVSLPARRPLVAGQIALSVVLAIAAGLLARSARELARTPPGFDSSGALTMRLTVPQDRYPDAASTLAYYRGLLDELRTLPGVSAVGAVTHLPMASDPGDWGLMIDGLPERLDNGRRPFADWMVVSDDYFDAMGIRVIEGRGFEAADVFGAPPVVVVNERMAREYWPGRSAIGGRLRMSSDVDPISREVVGVVADVRHAGLQAPPERQMFLPQFQFPTGGAQPPRALSVVVRTTTDAAQLAGPVRARIAERDRDVPVAQVRTMEDVVRASTSVPRLYLALFGVFTAIALAVVCVGVYGVASYLVAARRRELALRRALGATRGSVLWLVVREGTALAVAGTVIGIAGALAFAGMLEHVLFGVTTQDAWTFALVPLVVIAVAMAANLVPAATAVRERAMTALRE